MNFGSCQDFLTTDHFSKNRGTCIIDVLLVHFLIQCIPFYPAVTIGLCYPCQLLKVTQSWVGCMVTAWLRVGVECRPMGFASQLLVVSVFLVCSVIFFIGLAVGIESIRVSHRS